MWWDPCPMGLLQLQEALPQCLLLSHTWWSPAASSPSPGHCLCWWLPISTSRPDLCQGRPQGTCCLGGSGPCTVLGLTPAAAGKFFGRFEQEAAFSCCAGPVSYVASPASESGIPLRGCRGGDCRIPRSRGGGREKRSRQARSGRGCSSDAVGEIPGTRRSGSPVRGEAGGGPQSRPSGP